MLIHRIIESNLCRLPLVTKCASHHFLLRFFSLVIMNSGNKFKIGSSPGGSNTSRHPPSNYKQVSGNGRYQNANYGDGYKIAHYRSQMSVQNDHQSASVYLPDSDYNDQFPPLGEQIASSSKNGEYNKRRMRIDFGLEKKAENFASTKPEDLPVSKNVSPRVVSSTPQNQGLRPDIVDPSHFNRNYSQNEVGANNWDASEGSHNFLPFDICLSRRKFKHAQDWTREGVLRPGMILLKHFLTIREQIVVVRICQELGKGPGGFYQPGYNDGAKLRLRMMCLGHVWEPQTRKYGKKRQIDGSEPPVIPIEFKELVQKSISEAHALIRMDSEVSNVEEILPPLLPDICIVNFYNTSGRLGLHQDRDESRFSLQKGLPVVSFSIGDSAEFIYGDDRNADKADKVLLESGDVLIFGGESRHIFHGVSSIKPNSAPGALLDSSMLRPGRLNLTFRKY